MKKKRPTLVKTKPRLPELQVLWQGRRLRTLNDAPHRAVYDPHTRRVVVEYSQADAMGGDSWTPTANFWDIQLVTAAAFESLFLVKP